LISYEDNGSCSQGCLTKKGKCNIKSNPVKCEQNGNTWFGNFECNGCMRLTKKGKVNCFDGKKANLNSCTKNGGIW
jgi:hypothetical protein